MPSHVQFNVLGPLGSIMLNPTYSIIYGNIIFDSCPLFQEHN